MRVLPETVLNTVVVSEWGDELVFAVARMDFTKPNGRAIFAVWGEMKAIHFSTRELLAAAFRPRRFS